VSLRKELKKIHWQLYSFLTSEMCIFECLATEVYPQPGAQNLEFETKQYLESLRILNRTKKTLTFPKIASEHNESTMSTDRLNFSILTVWMQKMIRRWKLLKVKGSGAVGEGEAPSRGLPRTSQSAPRITTASANKRGG